MFHLCWLNLWRISGMTLKREKKNGQNLHKIHNDSKHGHWAKRFSKMLQELKPTF